MWRFVAGKLRAATSARLSGGVEGPQSVSGATCLCVAVSGRTCVDLTLQRLLVGASGRRLVLCSAAVPDTVEEVDGETWMWGGRGKRKRKLERNTLYPQNVTKSSVKVCTDDHPDGEADPRPHVQLHHEVDVDEDAEQGQPRQQRDLQETAGGKKKLINGGSVLEAVLSL